MSARDRVAESAADRELAASRVPELWATAEAVSRGSFFSPRTAITIYAELLRAYELGRQHERPASQVSGKSPSLPPLPSLPLRVYDHRDGPIGWASDEAAWSDA